MDEWLNQMLMWITALEAAEQEEYDKRFWAILDGEEELDLLNDQVEEDE